MDEEVAMRCPVDGTTLVLAERAGVEIDYCPDCRGVWLDRGKLDRILGRSGDGIRHGERSDEYRRRDEHERHHDGEHGHHHDRDHDHHRRGYGDRDDDRYGQPAKKRGGAFSALTGLLGGGED